MQGEELQLFPLPISKATLLQVQVLFTTEEEVGVAVYSVQALCYVHVGMKLLPAAARDGRFENLSPGILPTAAVASLCHAMDP